MFAALKLGFRHIESKWPDRAGPGALLDVEELAAASGRPVGDVLAVVAAGVAAGIVDASGPRLVEAAPGARAELLDALHGTHGARLLGVSIARDAGVAILQVAAGIAADDDERAASLEALAGALWQAARFEEAEAVARQAVAGRPGGASSGMARMVVGALLASGRRREAEQEALGFAAGAAPGERPWFEAAAALAAVLAGPPDDAGRRAARAEAAARTAGDPVAEVLALRVQVAAAQTAGLVDRALAAADRLVERARALPPGLGEPQAFMLAGTAAADADRHADALVLIAEGRRLAEGLGRVIDVQSGLALDGFVRAAAGAWGEALARFAEIAGPSGRLDWFADIAVWAATLTAMRGDVGEARRRLGAVEVAVADGATVSPVLLGWARSEVAIAVGDRAGAIAHLAGAWEHSTTSGAHRERRRIGPYLLRFALVAPDAYSAAGVDTAGVVAALDGLAARSPGVVGLAGAASWAHGLRARDGALVRTAADELSRAGRPHEAARARLDAALLTAPEDRAGAAAVAGPALDALGALGATTERDRAIAVLRAAGVPLGTRRRAAPASGWLSLTPAERRVAALVADGLSNPEVAERLFLATRTVSTHVSHVLRKLGLRSRTELAVFVAVHAVDVTDPG